MNFLKTNKARIILAVVTVVMLVSALSVTAFAASGDVAGAIQNTWNSAKTQIKSVVNNVVFPVIDLVLAVLFFAKVALAYILSERTSLYLEHYRYVNKGEADGSNSRLPPVTEVIKNV